VLGSAALGADESATLALGGLAPGTPPGTAITATYDGDALYAGSTSLALAAPGAGPGAAPVISGLRQSHLHWRAGSALARAARAGWLAAARQGLATPLRRHRTPVGTTFRFSLSAPATLSFAFK